MTSPFSHPARVHWEDTDTDAGGVVFCASHLKFFERARTEWLRAAGVGQRDVQSRFGVRFVVTNSNEQRFAPGRLDDELTVALRAHRAHGATLALEQQALLGDEPLADGRIHLACVEAATLKRRRIPTPILDTPAA